MDPRHNLGDSCSNCMFWLVWSSLSRELFWTLFQTKSLIYFIKIINKISSFKTSFKKNGFSCKKVWKIKLLSHWDHAWVFLVRYNAKRISRPKLYWFDWMKLSYVILFNRIRVHRWLVLKSAYLSRFYIIILHLKYL